MSQKGRPLRVAELIREEIAKLLMKGLKDPRIGFVSVMAVRMSPDLRYANVYVSLFGDERERKSSLIALQNSAGWIRREVGKYLRMRVTPEIRFFPDDTLDQVYHLEEVFQEIQQERNNAPMIQVGLPAIAQELRAAKAFLVVSHEFPDGDAVGSVLGMAHLLRLLGKERVVCALPDPVPRLYRRLPGANKITLWREESPAFDLAIILDVSSLDRIGKLSSWINPAAKKALVLDHHLDQGPEGCIGFIDASYAATGEIIADLFDAAEVPLNLEAAHCLYVAQITDTGGYRFSNTNPRSHRIAAKLLEIGLDVSTICSEVFEVISAPKLELLRRMLDRMETALEGRLAFSYVTTQDFAESGGAKEDSDGLINFIRNREGVLVGVLFNAVEAAVTKVSLRSRSGFDSAAFLGAYGGGGHAAAAGATVNRPLSEVQPEIIAQLIEKLGERA